MIYSILHTNDFHSHLTAEQAERLKSLRQELGDYGLLLDAGDAISSGNLTYRPSGESILDLMSDAGYDAMTVGNREFHLTQAGFSAKLSRARFPVLCANVRARDSQPVLPVKASIIRTLRNGFRIAVFGLTVPMITEKMLVRKVSAYTFDDPIMIARRLTPELRETCDLLVCLSHVGLQRDRELAAAVTGIDLMIGGHTHATLPEGERVGNTLIVQAGWWGHSLGTVRIDTSDGIRMTAGIEPL